uniref:Uncharacterized protein n=1 Tax=Caenorhabditis tropicalis TaxID=1561998 RepID=A0A1I7T9Z7_9PELO
MNSSAVTITISTISTTTTTPITITSSSHHVIASSSKNNETCIQIAEAIAAQGIDDITVVDYLMYCYSTLPNTDFLVDTQFETDKIGASPPLSTSPPDTFPSL